MMSAVVDRVEVMEGGVVVFVGAKGPRVKKSDMSSDGGTKSSPFVIAGMVGKSVGVTSRSSSPAITVFVI